jgi:hypothetical protein
MRSYQDMSKYGDLSLIWLQGEEVMIWSEGSYHGSQIMDINKVLEFPNFAYLVGVYNFYFLSNFDCLFSFNLSNSELPVVCRRISSISNCFRDKLNRKGPIVMHFFFENYFLYAFMMDHKKCYYFISTSGLKVAKILYCPIFGRHI